MAALGMSSQETETTSQAKQASNRGLVKWIECAASTVDEHIKDGRFQRSMALVAAGSSFVSGLEVGYEHYKGSYSNLIMYTPVLLSGVVTITSFGGFLSRRAAEHALRWSAATTLLDGIIGFGFHIRGIYRKPGGWRLPLTNMIMGPPIFAPLLFGTAAYLGFMASYLRREEDPKVVDLSKSQYTGWRFELHEGRFQKHLAGVAAVWTFFSGFEAWYSHYKSRFRIWAQWTPVILAPIQLGACIGTIFSERVAQRLLPVTSALAIVDGTVGFGYHARGILRRPGGGKTWLYNILYGPPIFAPLLFAACGALGFLASRLRREGRD
jgi:phosphate/sulfate permease